MAIALNIALPAVVTADDPLGQITSQSGGQQGGLFGLIFAGLADSANQPQSAFSGESPDGKAEAKVDKDVKGTGGECLDALMGQLSMGLQAAKEGKSPELVPAENSGTVNETSVQAAPDDGKSLPGKTPAVMLNKAATRLGQAIASISDEESMFSQPQLEEMRSAAGELKQAVDDLADQWKSIPTEGENQGKEGSGEKSLKRISGKLDELMSMMYMAGNHVSEQTAPDPGQAPVSGDPAGKTAEIGNMRQIVSSMQSMVEQCNDLLSGKQPDGTLQPVLQGSRSTEEKEGGISAMNRITDLPAWKAAGPADKNQILSSYEKVKDTADALAVKTESSVKPGEHANPFSMTVEEKNSVQITGPDGKYSAAGKPGISNADAVVRNSSASGEFSKESGETTYGSAESGKGNTGNTTQTNVNMGIHSFDMTVQVHEQSQNAAPELSKPVSHEQIMAQVREKLEANPSNGDVSRITLKLNPEDLGELKISMKMENQNLKVEIVAENQHVKDALMNNMDSLKETLSRQNISMDRFSVLTGGSFGNGDNYREWRQTSQNAAPNTFKQQYGFAEETAENSAGYLDSSENSLIDVRF